MVTVDFHGVALDRKKKQGKAHINLLYSQIILIYKLNITDHLKINRANEF